MSDRLNIVIAGGGITGLTCAALLARSDVAARFKLTLVDVAERPNFAASDDIALRVSAIATGSAELLDSVGAWNSVVVARACAYESMRVWDADDTEESPSALRFDAAEFAVPQLGFIVENVLLRTALLDVLDRHDVELRFATAIRSVRREGRAYAVVVGDDETLGADLIVAADGARSFVRNCVGIETEAWPYQQEAVVTHLRPELPHQSTAWQRFLRDGPLGMLPLSDGRISVVWSTTAARAADAKAASDAQLGKMLTEASGSVLGELVVEGPRGSFPLTARHARNYVMPGVALIGDAAHAIHPLAGQGANLGLQDAAELARVVIDALARGLNPADRPVLRNYERARKGANATMLHFMTGLNRLFQSDSAILGEIRSTGMRLFNRSGPIRERAVKVALGVGR
ncbi:MAG: FAD-dependent monooxygenase [Woeseiaceae bacterium]|nr:FAD-dependent monooxygenase [Woeseiaceae bacterium]